MYPDDPDPDQQSTGTQLHLLKPTLRLESCGRLAVVGAGQQLWWNWT